MRWNLFWFEKGLVPKIAKNLIRAEFSYQYAIAKKSNDLPQKIFGLNGVKLCDFRQNKHENALYWNLGMKARDQI